MSQTQQIIYLSTIKTIVTDQVFLLMLLKIWAPVLAVVLVLVRISDKYDNLTSF